jgi:hypothetical protein
LIGLITEVLEIIIRRPKGSPEAGLERGGAKEGEKGKRRTGKRGEKYREKVLGMVPDGRKSDALRGGHRRDCLGDGTSNGDVTRPVINRDIYAGDSMSHIGSLSR